MSLDIGVPQSERWVCDPSFRTTLSSLVIEKWTQISFQKKRKRSYAVLEAGNDRLFIKVVGSSKTVLQDFIAYFCGRGRAKLEWKNLRRTWSDGQVSSEPLAYCETFSWSSGYRGFLVLRALDQPLTSLDDWMRSKSSRQICRAFERAAAFLALLHSRGHFHLDFTRCNVFGRPIESEWYPKRAIDFEKYRYGRVDNLRLAARSLHIAARKLHSFSATERLRIFVAYCRASHWTGRMPRRYLLEQIRDAR